MRDYEAVLILDPRLDEASMQQAVERITGAITAKGELTKLDTWGRRRLAYEIRHLGEGYYLIARFKGDSALVDELDHLLKVGEEYLRAKIVRIP